MNAEDSKKRFHKKSWGNWRYYADTNTLWRSGDRAPFWGVNTANKVLQWLAYMNDEGKCTEQDLKSFAEAYSDILECPGLAGAYHTTGNTLVESKRKVISDSGSACDNCHQRFSCYTSNPRKLL